MRIFLLINLLMFSVLIYAQEFPYTKYTISDGLAQSQVIALEIDAKERVWAGTNGGGISVYDGVSFTNYTTKDGLSSDYIYSLFKDSKNNIWVGTNSGVCIYNKNGFYQYTDGFKDKEIIYSITESNKGEIIVGSSFGLKKFKNNKFENIVTNSIVDSSIILKVFNDKDDNIWIGTRGNGLIKYDGLKVKQFLKKDKLPYNTVRTIFQDENDNIIVGTDRGACFINKVGLIILPEGKNTQSYTDGFLSKSLDVIFINYNGWFIVGKIIEGVASNKNVVEFSEKSLRQTKQDKEGNIWIGTNNGLIKFDSEIKFVSYFSSKSVNDGVNSFAIFVNDTNIFISDFRKGIRVVKNYKVYIKNPLKYSLLQNSDKIVGGRIFSFADNNTDTLWVSTWSGITGLDLKTDSTKNFSSNDKLTIRRVVIDKKFNPITNASIVMPDSSIWFGTKEGIIIYKNGKFSLLADSNKVYDRLRNIEIIKLVLEDNDVWATTKNGIIKITKNGIEEYGLRDGFVDTQVNDMTIDLKGNIWLSSREGLFFYNRKKFLNISTKFNIDFGSIYIIQKDDLNNLYIGTNKGLDKFSLKDFYQNDTIVITHYGEAEGFLGVECNRGASFKDKDGNLWFGTVNGVVKYFPKKDVKNTVEPDTYISNIMLSLGKDSLSDYCNGVNDNNLPNNLELAYNKTHLTFHFISTSKKIPSKVKYEYKLVPLNEDWMPVSNNIADFPILPDGEYVFMVRSSNNDGVWDSSPAEFKFVVNPPFWKTLWFILSVVLLGIVIVYLFIKSRERKLRKEKEILEEKVTERTVELVKQKEIVEEKNKDITDSINYARNIQQALLPGEEDFRNSFEKSLIVYKPRDIVSGDFYWLTTKNKRTFITAADSTGHGVPGAFMSMLGMAFLDQIVSKDASIDAAGVLNQMRQNVMSSLKQGEKGKSRDGMDMALSIIDWESNQFEFAGANNPLYIISKDTKKVDSANGEDKEIEPVMNGENDYNLFEIKPDKMPIGYYIKTNDFTNHVIEIVKGDIIFMFSDGYADQFGGEEGKKFKYKKFKSLLLEMAHLPIEQQQLQIDNTFEEWKKGYEQLDDIIVVGIIL